ncbi:hypothetical protein [Blastococcus sp. SYSU DS0617]
MRLYAPDTAMRVRQLAADGGLLLWIIGWVLVARAVHGAVLSLAEPGQAVEHLGDSVARNMGSAAGVAEDVPLVGDELAGPFEALAQAGDSVRGAGQSAQDAVDNLAGILAVALIVLPVAFILARWLPWRTRWVREATAADRLLSGHPGAGPDLELLAARALATAPLPRLAALPPGTGAAWRAGDPAAVRALAALELDRLGLRLSDPASQPGHA